MALWYAVDIRFIFSFMKTSNFMEMIHNGL